MFFAYVVPYIRCERVKNTEYGVFYVVGMQWRCHTCEIYLTWECSGVIIHVKCYLPWECSGVILVVVCLYVSAK